MSELRAQIAAAWHKAASELQFRFTSPYSTTLKNGATVHSLGLVHGFSAAFGTLIFVEGEERLFLVEGNERLFRAEDFPDEYGWSILSDMYAKYERKLFVETLDEWGWFGPKEHAPSWYTGRPDN